MGFIRQRIQVGGLRLERYNPDVALAGLLRSKQTYTGMESDAPWRAEADAWINASLSWPVDHGITARGTTLIWPSWRHTPTVTEALKENPNALRTAIEERITTTVSRWRGRLVDWDVANETYTHHQLQDVLGKDSVAEWFELARAADPEVKLYINDYGILNAGAKEPPHQQSYFYTAMFSHQAIEGISMWGFWSEAHWRPKAALFDANFQPRPHAIAYENLVRRDWWTDETALTDIDGKATIRVFLGDHAVSVTVAGETSTAMATHEHGGSTMTVHRVQY